MSGTDLPDGASFAKDVTGLKEFVSTMGDVPAILEDIAERVAKQGATPLAVAVGPEILGIVGLSDVLKPGIQKRLGGLERWGSRASW